MIEWYGDEALKKIAEAAKTAVFRGTELVHETGTQKILSGPATGKVYKRRGVEHQASAPGEAPASDTGNLAQDSETEYTTDGLTGSAVWRAIYAARLENGFTGTDSQGRAYNMEPRPFALPSLVEKKNEIDGFFEAELKAVLS